MRYPVVIEIGNDTTRYGVIFPAHPGWTSGVVTLDSALIDDTTERVNLTLPRRVLRRLDALARAAGESRSGSIVQRTLGEPTPMP